MSGVSEAAVEAAATAMYDSVAVLMRFPTGWDEAPDSLRDSYRGMARAAHPAIRADIAAEVQAATWDEVGGSMWFDRHQWGVIIDGLVLQRAEALTRKAANEYSNSDERAEMCVDLIRQINAADPLALSTAKEATT